MEKLDLCKKKPAFMLAAPSSGSGKTTLTLALLRILARRGYRVQPFKCGPDYLDTRLHSLAASYGSMVSDGINLDTFMASESHVKELFSRYSCGSDASVVEGVMGLFDGAEKARGSSAEIAKLLGIPVIMVVNAQSMAYSAAPLLYGYRTFDPDVHLVGVIFNQVNTPSHYRYLEEAAFDAGVDPLGYVPRHEPIVISERHLGLNTSSSYDRQGAIEAMADHIEKSVAVDRLLELVGRDRESFSGSTSLDFHQRERGEKVIAVARDEAFNFTYLENLDVLSQFGRIEFFSPMEDGCLPACDLLYLAGGYPELYAETLSSNSEMRRAIAAYCLGGGAAYAECGGMMYLGAAMTLGDGLRYPMCGVLDLDTTMQDSRLTLGYRKVRLDTGYTKELRGHEFHYSRIERSGELHTIASITNARDEATETLLFRRQNTFASYLHLYWGETRDFPAFLLNRES
ncbi:MAG: cobyrinate a,c-diamide synthase [Chlorobium phaeobacteroides]|jgi:cobyrinic acid a,c-diamide synthase|nr:cobyrinate a,c-diamide synthase [Chlorobium phaeobacteroides]